jgi:hypothetical protein
MSRFGFVTPNDPPRAPRSPKTRKNQLAYPPGPRKMPRKIPRAARHIFQNWKARSHFKRNLNKLGYKRETAERCSNPLDPESVSLSASQESALRHLLIFRYRWTMQKSQLGMCWNFWVSWRTQKSALSLHHSRINFHCRTLPRIFWMSGWNSHVRLLPDYRVFRVTVRSTEIYKNCMFQLSTFLGNFSSKNLEFAIFKIFLIATWNSHSEYYVFLVYQMGAPLFRIAATFVDEFSRLHWHRGYLRDYWEFHKGF